MALRVKEICVAASIVLVGGAAHGQEQAPAELEPLVVETSKAKAAKKIAAPKKAPAAQPIPQVPAPQEVAKPQAGGSAAPTRDTYQPANTYSATKTDTPVIETPQSITTVTRKQMDDQDRHLRAGSACARKVASTSRCPPRLDRASHHAYRW